MKTLTQRVRFPGASAKELYDLYMDSKKHTEALGGEAKMSKKGGAPFSAWDGYITGKNLALVPSRLVVQSWRSTDFDATDPDSVLVLQFEDGLVTMVHANVPEGEADALDEGWRDHYWKRWRAWLKGR